MTALDVANALGIHRPSYSMIELEIRNCSIAELSSLAVVYNVTVPDLLGPGLAKHLRFVR